MGSIAESTTSAAPRHQVENVFKADTYGVTRGTSVAEADTPTARTQVWVVLKHIPIDLEFLDLDGQSGSPVAGLPPSLPPAPL